MTKLFKVFVNGSWVTQQPVDGDLVREYPNTDVLPNHFVEYTYQEVTQVNLDNYFTLSDSLEQGGQSLTGVNHVYYAESGSELTLSCDIVDAQGSVQTQIDAASLGYPPVLKMPCVKFAGGLDGTVVDEVYFNVTLINGVLTATGTLPSSGDWKLLEARLNQSLASIGADWRITRPNVTFLV